MRQISIENFFHPHSRQSTINPAAINHHHVQGHLAKTNSIIFFFFFFQFQQRNHTRYCIGKCLYINIRSDLHWKNSTQTKKKSKYITKIISDINKKNRCYRWSFFSNHFLRAVTSMAMNILSENLGKYFSVLLEESVLQLIYNTE